MRTMMVEPIQISLGPIEAYIEPDSGQLRYVRIGNTELLRGIYAAVREADWGTVVPAISNFKVQKTNKGFQCRFDADHHKGEIYFVWQGQISGKDLGEGKYELEYEFVGSPKSDFQTCRTGICVLHPRSQQGKKIEVEHNGGPCELGVFPLSIKPDQPFKDVKAITLELEENIGLKIEFFGEVFEMEDQRNWSDPSYKTYCRPQEWGSPYLIKKDQKIEHRIKLMITSAGEVKGKTVNQMEGKIPNLGTVINRVLSESEISALKELNLGHFQATAEGLPSARKFGEPVFLQTQTANLPIDFAPSDGIALNPPQSWQKLNSFRGALRLAASLGNFVDLNRCRPTFDEIEGVAYAMNPQVHAFDTLTMMECTWTLQDSVQSSREFGAKTVMVGPIILKQGGIDQRITGIESALFTLSSIAHLAKANADFATFFDAQTLANSPAALVLELLKDLSDRSITIFDSEPSFVMIQGEKTILANLSWQPSELFKETPLDLPENIKVGIKGSYRLFTSENIADWRQILSGPPSHNILSEMPPFSIVVIG